MRSWRSVLQAFVSLLAIAGLSAGPAWADTPSFDSLQRHDTIVRVTYTQPLYHLDVYGLVRATPDEVWRAITSYDHYDAFLPLVTNSHLKRREGNVAYQYVRMSPPWPFHVQWMVNANAENKAQGSLSFSEADGNVKQENGYWQVTGMAPDETCLQYHLNVDPWMDLVPSWLVLLVTNSVLPDIIHGVRKEVRAARAAS